MPSNYYMILGVEREADLAQIKRAYRDAIKRYHPDKGGSATDPDKFMQARQAYEVLSDAELRRAYDAELRREGIPHHVTDMRQAAARRRSRPWRGLRDAATPLDAFFGDFLSGRHRRHLQPPSEVRDLYMEVVLTPQEARRGGTYPVSVPLVRPCPHCRRGAGGALFCPTCRGRGTVSGRGTFNLVIPPNVDDGSSASVSLEPVGLRGVRLVIDIRVATH